MPVTVRMEPVRISAVFPAPRYQWALCLVDTERRTPESLPSLVLMTGCTIAEAGEQVVFDVPGEITFF